MKKLQGGSPELFQWTIIAFTVLIVATLTVNAIRLQSTTRDLARKVDTLEASRQMVPSAAGIVEAGSPGENANTPAGAPVVAPNVVTIPGSRASISLPGTWEVTAIAEGLRLNGPSGDIGVVKSVAISEEDFQEWLKKQGDFSSYTWGTKQRITVGPNQILMAGKLAEDITLVGYVPYRSNSNSVDTHRLSFVRDGGTVVVLYAHAEANDAETIVLWEQALQTLSFAS
jgi:hypothetical protein